MMTVIATNRKAQRDYQTLETIEAGMVLKGVEVKALREAKVTLSESYARLDGLELFLYNLHIPRYSHASEQDLDPTRTRKLLLNHSEIQRLIGKVEPKGRTLIPLKIYFKSGYAKVLLGLAIRRKTQDKRDRLRKKEAVREVERALRNKK
jgi:SsrA-binding protein